MFQQSGKRSVAADSVFYAKLFQLSGHESNESGPVIPGCRGFFAVNPAQEPDKRQQNNTSLQGIRFASIIPPDNRGLPDSLPPDVFAKYNFDAVSS